MGGGYSQRCPTAAARPGPEAALSNSCSHMLQKKKDASEELATFHT